MDQRFEDIAKFIPDTLFNPKQVANWQLIATDFHSGSFACPNKRRILLTTDCLSKCFPPGSIDAKGSSLTALAYLFRRFGAPALGCDASKTICSYYLTTPHPEVFLRVNIALSSLKHCFGIGLGTDPCTISATEEEIYQALTVTASELMRPVECRDSLLNILGIVSDDSGDVWIEQEDGEFVPIRAMAERSFYSGHGYTPIF